VSSARVEKVVTSGTFSLDGGSWDVDNNVWLVGDDHEVLVIDAAHDAASIVEAIGGRQVVAVVCTHGHNDHINAAGDLFDATEAPIWLHPADRMLWDHLYEPAPDHELADGTTLRGGGNHADLRTRASVLRRHICRNGSTAATEVRWCVYAALEVSIPARRRLRRRWQRVSCPWHHPPRRSPSPPCARAG
jgi:Metallo-beta-lactamase superfamily